MILAGGLARRMGGGDKPLRLLAGRPILSHVLDRLAPQVVALALSANGDPARFADVAPGLPILPDPVRGHPGPLAGILAGLEHAAASGFAWVLTVTGDSPFLPTDLADRLDAARAASGARAAHASSAGRTHPPIGLWSVALRDDLRAALRDGEARVARWASRHAAVADWPVAPHDPFLNLNTPADLEAAEAILAPPGSASPAGRSRPDVPGPPDRV